MRDVIFSADDPKSQLIGSLAQLAQGEGMSPKRAGFDASIAAFMQDLVRHDVKHASRRVGMSKAASTLMPGEWGEGASAALTLLQRGVSDPRFQGWLSFVKAASVEVGAGRDPLRIAQGTVEHDMGLKSDGLTEGYEAAALRLLEIHGDVLKLATTETVGALVKFLG